MRYKFLIVAITLLALAQPACFGLQPAVPSPPAVPARRPEVLTFKASPSKVENGTATRLHWEVTGADNVTIDHGLGTLPLTGSLEVKPFEITAYNLTASNSGGTIVSSVIINVVSAVPIASSASSPSVIPPGRTSGALPALRENESYVYFGKAVMVGADNDYIVLHNNPVAHNPTWAGLKAFLQADRTDRESYVAGKFTCGDFAEMLHNNAEAAGIRAAVVAVELKPAGLAEGVINHSSNAFETTDRGIVFIDVTSSSQGFYADKIVNVIVGNEYQPMAIFNLPGQAQIWSSMGRIEAIDVFQW